MIGTNYFGVFYLTEKLLPYLTSLPHEVVYIDTISLVQVLALSGIHPFTHLSCRQRYWSERGLWRLGIVSFNGKTRFFLEAQASDTPAAVEAAVRAHEKTPQYVGDMTIAKVIVVPGRIVNVVLKK